MIIYHLISITLAVIIDCFIGDPSRWPHPVRWMGNFIALLDRHLNQGKYKKGKGIVLLLLVTTTVLVINLLVSWGAYEFHYIMGIIVEACLIATTISQKDLKTAALRVYKPLTDGDIEDARYQVSMIVGRDTEELDENEIIRATVETVAESIGDGITSSLFWAFIGGAPLAMMYRAVNTCDSMIGHKNEHYHVFGWASAKFDDVLNWIPSRITSFLMMLTNRVQYLKRKEAIKCWRVDAQKHPSRNSGFFEAAVALLLGIQLGGINYYNGLKSDRARMGISRRSLEKKDILHTIKIMQRAIFSFVIILWTGGGIIGIASAWF
ncbi:adenosylcobinamide-phosphate synthase CbiB [Tetragenococcus halophilus]|uniref:adenosylcobinamide-phosphate synthase CbiB n=1 Tax=Tetragenococcus halophilus TaxID=51669 RepID=UPI001F2F6D06|nr:adenosylcobinamide-phosphate synthase CbiB [Tetragenococcus halophilus]MCF1601973.1 adenosylcobinamide-phosphate synthase CbiB [Tetragenococcus halophilus]